ncbi:MAG: cyanophycinase [Balneolales bacterium]
MNGKEIPKGILIAIGGSEDKGLISKEGSTEKSPMYASAILKKITSFLSSEKCRIEVITTASDNPEIMRKTYQEAFASLGFSNLGFIHMESKEEADFLEYQKRLRETEGVFFTGGSQTKLLNIYKESRFVKELINIYYSKTVVISGTSAGAMVMPTLMIDVEAHFKLNTFIIKEGFSLIENVIIDTHFSERGRFWRLAEAVAQNQKYLGLGMDENTAIVVRNGNDMEVIGSGLIAVIEGQHISYFQSSGNGTRKRLTIENIVSHILSQGDRYNIAERRILKKEPDRKKKRISSKA